jgi:hypothetical protein
MVQGQTFTHLIEPLRHAAKKFEPELVAEIG